jgi:hypothetical protein
MLRDSTMRTSLRSRRLLSALGLGAAVALAFAAASSADTTQAAPAPGGDAPAQVGGASKFDKDTHIVELKSAGAYEVNKEGKVEITLETKGDFHINDKYPLKFKAVEPAPEGVTFAKALLKRDDGKFEEKKGSLPVAFTAAKAGKFTIAGVLSFGVCNATSCVMDKVELALDVDVK